MCSRRPHDPMTWDGYEAEPSFDSLEEKTRPGVDVFLESAELLWGGDPARLRDHLGRLDVGAWAEVNDSVDNGATKDSVEWRVVFAL